MDAVLPALLALAMNRQQAADPELLLRARSGGDHKDWRSSKDRANVAVEVVTGATLAVTVPGDDIAPRRSERCIRRGSWRCLEIPTYCIPP